MYSGGVDFPVVQSLEILVAEYSPQILRIIEVIIYSSQASYDNVFGGISRRAYIR